MNNLDTRVFINLFKEAFEKCFGLPLTSSLSETDSKLFSNKIFEKTGLVIGAKSIKNYSLFVINNNSKEVKKENPSVATLDTFARYVLNAPYTNEVHRKDHESHFPYWFQYRSRNSHTKIVSAINWKKYALALLSAFAVVIIIFVVSLLINKDDGEYFNDNFDALSEDSLSARGWIIKSPEKSWWDKRSERPGHLALYTLRGDNWPNFGNKARIKNLLMRRINAECFITEVHLTEFIPEKNWQQAGIILSEDSTLTGKMLRMSVSYNNFFGGYEKPAEIIIQVISSSESGKRSKPEEIAHLPLFNLDSGKEKLVGSNLKESALKIEKKGSHFRFLYTASSIESFTFKEAAGGDFNIHPKYVSIFSIQGWAEKEDYIPAYFDSFGLAGIPCE